MILPIKVHELHLEGMVLEEKKLRWFMLLQIRNYKDYNNYKDLSSY